MSAHTPGPWTLGSAGRIERYDPPGRLGIVVHICHVTSDADGEERDLEAEANARLIAAAPELFGAIVYLLRRVGTDPDLAYYCGYGTETLERAVRAYAAAVGRDADEVRDEVLEDKQPSYRRREARVVELQRRVEQLEQACAAHGLQVLEAF